MVGGQFAGNQSELENILTAALDLDDQRIELIGLEDDNFAVQVSVGGKTDTVLFTGDVAEAAIDVLESGVVNPGNRASQFVVIEDGDSGTVGIGGGGLNVTDGVGVKDIGGVLSVDDVLELAETAEARPNVNAIDQGDTVRVEFPGNNNSIEVLVISDSVGDLLDGGEFTPASSLIV
ncbi:MAG: hypothetical protein ACFB6S_14295 [Geminicoccaceae bacterium]